MPDDLQQDQKPGGERFFVAVVTVIVVLFALGYVSLMFALNHVEHNPPVEKGFVYENPKPRFIPPDHPRQLIDFSLIDRTERVITRKDLENKILVVDFLFTSCSLTCPAINAQMHKIQQMTTNQPDIMLVSLTVDPRDDTPAVLMKYGDRFGADTNRWLLLTGERSTLYNLIKTSFLPQELNDPSSYMPGNFSNTYYIALVDSSGRLEGFFDGLNQNTPAAVLEEIKILRGQKN